MEGKVPAEKLFQILGEKEVQIVLLAEALEKAQKHLEELQSKLVELRGTRDGDR